MTLEDSRSPRRIRRRTDPVLAALFLINVAVVAWLGSGVAGFAAAATVSWTGMVATYAAYAYFCRRVLSLLPRKDPAHRFWAAMYAGSLVLLLGYSTQFIMVLRDPREGLGENAVAMGAFGINLFMVIITLLTYPMGVRTGRQRLCLWLDIATVTVCGTTFSLYVMDPRGPTAAGVLDWAAYIIVTQLLVLICLFALAKVMITGNTPFSRMTWIIGCTSLALGVVASATLDPLVRSDAAHWFFAIWLSANFLTAAFARVQHLYLLRGIRPSAPYRERRYSPLPYLSIAATYALLVQALATAGPHTRTWYVVVGLIVATGVVVARQLIAFKDNSDLLSRLDTTLRELAHHEQRQRALLRHSSDITFTIDAAGRLTYVSPAVRSVLGRHADDLIGTHWLRQVHPDDRRQATRATRVLLGNPDEPVTCQTRVRHANGSWRWLGVIATNQMATPAIGGIVCNARDVTETRHLHDRLRHRAHHDPLTDLANRVLFTEMLGHALSTSESTAVIMIDLDDFKPINDTYGHETGDAVLVHVARVLKRAVRDVDTAARLGGDEFAIVLPHTTGAQAAEVAKRLLARLATPADCDGHPITVGASIGVATSTESVPAGPDDLVRRADQRMYRMKAEKSAQTREAHRAPARAPAARNEPAARH